MVLKAHQAENVNQIGQKMGKIIKVEGYDSFLEKLEELKGNTALFLLFSGSKDAQTGTKREELFMHLSPSPN